MKDTHQHMEAYLKCFDDYRCLSRSEESKSIWSRGTVFNECLHTFTLFLSRKTSVIVETFQWSLCVAFIRRSLYFFSKSFLFFYLMLWKERCGTCLRKPDLSAECYPLPLCWLKAVTLQILFKAIKIPHLSFPIYFFYLLL